MGVAHMKAIFQLNHMGETSFKKKFRQTKNLTQYSNWTDGNS